MNVVVPGHVFAVMQERAERLAKVEDETHVLHSREAHIARALVEAWTEGYAWAKAEP